MAQRAPNVWTGRESRRAGRVPERVHAIAATKLARMGRAWADDPGLRRRAEADPPAALAEYDLEAPPNCGVRIVANTEHVHWFVLPPDPNAQLADHDLTSVSGGRNGDFRRNADGTSTMSCASSIPSSISTFSTVGP